MLIIKSFHIMSMVAWFAGLFYLPRLFVYHAEANDRISIERFNIMQRRLFYAITFPAAILTNFFGVYLLRYNWDYYLNASWMRTKLGLVIFLWIYHLSCGYFVKQFAKGKNNKSARFFRIYNEIPTLFLVAIVLLVVVKPF